MNIDELVAIDVHTHAEVSCHQPMDPFWEPFDAAASKYFKVGKRPTIAEDPGLLPGEEDWPCDVYGRFRVSNWKSTDTERRRLSKPPATMPTS